MVSRISMSCQEWKWFIRLLNIFGLSSQSPIRKNVMNTFKQCSLLLVNKLNTLSRVKWHRRVTQMCCGSCAKSVDCLFLGITTRRFCGPPSLGIQMYCVSFARAVRATISPTRGTMLWYTLVAMDTCRLYSILQGNCGQTYQMLW